MSFRDFRFHQASRFLNTLGNQMATLAVAWVVWDRTRDPLCLGYVGLAQFLPSIALVLVTGHVADHFDRRKIVLVCNVAVIACWALLWALLSRPAISLAGVYAVLVFYGTLRAFGGPANSSLLPMIVPREHLSRAIAVASTVWQVAAITGPALGGVLVSRIHAQGVFLASVTMCAIASWCVWRIRISQGPASASRGFSWQTLLAGVRYVYTERILLGTISLDLFAVLLGGAVALLPIFAREILQVGPRGLGLLRSAPSIGAAAMAMMLSWRPIRRHAGPWMLACVGLFGVATVVFGASHHLALSFVALLVVGASDMVSVVVRQHTVQVVTPDAMRGRVSAVNSVFVGASNELGEFESGLTASWWGAERAAIYGGLGTCAVVLLWTAFFPSLRKLDRLDVP